MRGADSGTDIPSDQNSREDKNMNRPRKLSAMVIIYTLLIPAQIWAIWHNFTVFQAAGAPIAAVTLTLLLYFGPVVLLWRGVSAGRTIFLVLSSVIVAVSITLIVQGIYFVTISVESAPMVLDRAFAGLFTEFLIAITIFGVSIWTLLTLQKPQVRDYFSHPSSRAGHKYVLYGWSGMVSLICLMGVEPYFHSDANVDSDHLEHIRELPIWDKNSFPGWRNMGFVDRFESCSNQAYLNFIDESLKYEGRFESPAEPGKFSQGTFADLKDLINKWPEELLAFADKHVAKVFVVKNMAHAGRIFCYYKNNRFIIFLSEHGFNNRPNTYATAFENAFLGTVDSKNIIWVKIENDEDNYSANHVESTLIHELGHAIGSRFGVTPNPYNFGLTKLDDAHSDFLKSAYYTEYVRSAISDPEFNTLKDLRHPKGEKISLISYLRILTILEASPFPTTAATWRSAEYFAESFWSYIHCVVQRRPYSLTVVQNGQTVKEMGNGILREQNKWMIHYFDDLMKKIGKI